MTGRETYTMPDGSHQHQHFLSRDDRIDFHVSKDGRSYPFRIGQTFNGDLFIRLEYDGVFVVTTKKEGPTNFAILRFARDADQLTAQESK